MNKTNVFWIILIITISFSVYAEEPLIKNGERLNMERCIEIALKVQPTLMRDRYVVMQKEALLSQARSSYYPKVDVSAGVTRSFIEKQTNDPVFKGAYPYNAYNQNNGTASLNQMIYDFGRTPSDVKTKKFDLESSRFDLDSTITTVSNNVRSAYYEVLRAKRSRDVNLEAVNQNKQHLEQAKTLFTAGKKPKYDVTKAELDLSNAGLKLISAENDLKIAQVKLNNAMGIDETVPYTIEDTLSYSEYAITLEEALDRAYRNRPDFKSLMAQKNAAAMAVKRATKDYLPSINGKAGYGFAGSEYPLGQGWNAGVVMTMNIFEGNLTRNKVEESIAKAHAVEANIESKRLDILLDVKQAYLNLMKAGDAIANTEVQVKQATENLELANLRYSAGLADPLEVTDASVSYSQAKLSNISSLYDYKIAQANIEKAMGNK
jgi:outer membrane protein TolC